MLENMVMRGLPARTLAAKSRVAISRAPMRVIGASLAVNDDFVLPTRSRRPTGTVVRPDALHDAHDLTMVPSTLKCSADSRRFTFGWASAAAKNLKATSPPRGRFWFLVPGRIPDAEPHEPAERQVELQPLHSWLDPSCGRSSTEYFRRMRQRRFRMAMNRRAITVDSAVTKAKMNLQSSMNIYSMMGRRP